MRKRGNCDFRWLEDVVKAVPEATVKAWRLAVEVVTSVTNCYQSGWMQLSQCNPLILIGCGALCPVSAGNRRGIVTLSVPSSALLRLLLRRVQGVQKKHPIKPAGVAGGQVRAPGNDRRPW